LACEGVQFGFEGGQVIHVNSLGRTCGSNS
jgi:hypothetical protein